MPDQNGLVTFTGPAGTLPPGTQVLVVNEGTGDVASFTADNDGAIGGSLLASIQDRLLVTITDPLGNVITFERGEYRAPDGTTAVNSAGGIVTDASCSAGLEACPGVELRIPPDAVEDAVVLQLKALALSLLPEGPLPDLELPNGQIAQLAAALEIKSDGTPTFNQPVDLVFPKPATAPEGASYFVVRRLTGPDGLVAYETVDVAKVEGEGADAKIVTASEPFSGYLYTQPGFSLTGLDPSGAMGTQFVNTAILYWAFDEALPGRPLGGAITGRVLRVTWNPGSSVPDYEPVAGAMVSGVDVTGEPLWATARPGESAGPNVAVSQADGTYALIDLHYQGGPVTIAARIEGETKTATAFQANPQDLKSPGLQFVRHVAVADITFPAVAPAAPPSAIEIRMWTLDAEGRPAPSSGVVVAGTPVIIGASSTEAQIRGAEIAGGGLTPASFAVRPRNDTDPPGVAAIIDPNFVPPQPGTYTVTVFAQPAFGGEVRTTVTFRAVAVAGGSLDPIAPDPPAVITARLVPKPNATGVSVSVYPQIAFTEPVKNVLGQVTLTDDTGAEVPIVLLGAGPDGPVDNVTAETVVTSLTLQPLTGLQYATRYTLRLTDQIVDLDTNATTGGPDPHHLAPFESTFTTFEPTALGATEEQFTTGGLAILNDRAYVAQNRGRTTAVRLYDVSDPTQPVEITGDPTENFALVVPPPVLFPGHPADLVAEANSPLTGGPVIAVATTNLTYPYQPSNVRLYDVSDDQTWRWIGAVSLGSSPVDGQAQRIVLRGELLYAVTAGVGKGIRVVDLAKAREIFDAQTANGEADPMFWEMQQRLGLEGQGFAQEAIVQTIFLDTGTGQMSLQRDLAVIDLNVDGVTQPIVVATGRTPLSIVNPQTGEVLYNGPICAEGATVCDAASALTSWGWTIAAGVVQGRPLAFVAAAGPAGASDAINRLVVIDLTDLRTPRALGTVTFAGNPASQGLVLQGEQLFIGTDTGTTIVSLTNPAQPQILGIIAEVAGRLAFADGHLLLGTVSSANTRNPLGGVKTAALGSIAVVRDVSPPLVIVDESGTTMEPLRVTYQLLGVPSDILDGALNVDLMPGSSAATPLSVRTLPLPAVRDGVHQMEVPAGLPLALPSSDVQIEVTLPDGRVIDPYLTSIRTPPASSSVLRDLEATSFGPPRFDTVNPTTVPRGRGAITISVTGINLGQMRHVFLLVPSGSWQELATATRTPTEVTAQVPTAVFQTAGFVRIAPQRTVERSLALLVTAEALPAPGTNADVVIEGVEPSAELGPGQETITLSGSGFGPGMRVVLGRGQKAGLILPTTVVSDTEMTASLPADFLGAAKDLFAAVLSSDDVSLSAPTRLVSYYPDPVELLLERELDVANEGEPPAPTLTAVLGDLHWNRSNQRLELEGIGLTAGMSVRFVRGTGAGAVSIAASTVPSTRPPSRSGLVRVEVPVPTGLVEHPFVALSVQIARASQPPVRSPLRPLPVPEILKVPFGGRTALHAYTDPAAQHVFLFADGPTGAPAIRPVPGGPLKSVRKLPKDAFGIVFESNPQKPSGLTVVRREQESDDPSAVFLRGTGLTHDVGNARVRVTTGRASRAYEIEVVKKALGGPTPRFNDVIAVADEFGMPPQFLKAQIQQESDLFRINFRYEPITRDYAWLGGNTTEALYQGVRRITASPWNKYVQSGRMLSLPLGPKTGSQPLSRANSTDGTGTSFQIGVPMARSDRKPTALSCAQAATLLCPPQCPESDPNCHQQPYDVCVSYEDEVRDAAVEATVVRTDGPAQSLTLVHDYPVWRKVVPKHVCAPTGLIQPAAPLTPGRFTVEYETGTIRLGQPLADGETLVVRHWPIVPPDAPLTPGADNVEPVSTNDPFVIDLDNRNVVKELPSKTYRNDELERALTLGEWFETNLKRPGRQLGGWLTGTFSERHLEFTVEPDGRPGRPIDAKYKGLTIQPFAASSYGPLQVLLEKWTDSNVVEPMTSILNPTEEPIFTLFTDHIRGLKLGAILHLREFNSLRQSNSLCGTCTSEQWTDLWRDILKRYNPRGVGYRDQAIIKRGLTYEPKP